MAVPIAGSFNADSTMQSVEAFLTHLQSRTTDGERVHGHVTSFQGKKQKDNYLESLAPGERADNQLCTTISAAMKDLPTSGGLALMTSDTQGAARAANESSPWHCICVLRKGSILWVYDPAYDSYTITSKRRIGETTGLAMLKALWAHCDKNRITINDVRIIGVADERDQCLPLACLWMEEMVLRGRTAWPNLEDCEDWRQITQTTEPGCFRVSLESRSGGFDYHHGRITTTSIRTWTAVWKSPLGAFNPENLRGKAVKDIEWWYCLACIEHLCPR